MKLPDKDYERLEELLKRAKTFIVDDLSPTRPSLTVAFLPETDRHDLTELRHLLLKLCGPRNALQKCQLFNADPISLLPVEFRTYAHEILAQERTANEGENKVSTYPPQQAF